MSTPEGTSANKEPHVVVVAFYDGASGHIVHIHKIVALDGAPSPSEDEAIARATSHATRVGRSLHGLRSKVSTRPELGNRPQRIDVATGEFVATHSAPRERV